MLVDLHIHDHPEPLDELQRLLTLHAAYEHMNAGDAALEKSDMERALTEYARAAELQPENVEIVFWNALTLATNDRMKDAIPRFRRVFAADKNWVQLLRRLPATKLVDEETVQRILLESED